MRIVECDRCGKFTSDSYYHIYANGQDEPDGHRDEAHIDLCPNCYRELIEWLERKAKRLS